jgi:hypothetical protein
MKKTAMSPKGQMWYGLIPSTVTEQLFQWAGPQWVWVEGAGVFHSWYEILWTYQTDFICYHKMKLGMEVIWFNENYF